ncbi:ABC-2 type transport system ATP-binding protein [Salsuginibacillus halophilus]|uniref:ABC-2 type transport system ATP-binding protein n=1 Tax=Salsuginibacillus halophilus TaxID=517424 RepID=A0A2P8HG07_9BACI|nr:ABC transporter ATP-binding protein [Salsuginibacillus halophilus]PSL45152.1 ABC-2 type transport system ATP-binding protein [Salsuginibacillus halophilus]
MSALLNIEGITGGYSVQKPVLHDVSFTVHTNEIVGLIGLNGAGKSTTIKHVLGLMEPSKGSIALNGRTFVEDPEAYRQALSFIPETPILYEELNLWEHLQLAAMAYGIDEDVFERRAQELLKTFRMEKMKRWFPSHFSKGMRQKVMIMCAFLVDPELYVVDEPFVGLDPVAIQSLLDRMTEMKANGAGILMSTHILTTAEKYCDRFVLLHDGVLKMKGTLEELQQQAGMPGQSLDDIYIAVTKEGSE